MIPKVVVHENPAWRERGNLSISVKLAFGQDMTLQRVEQLWCRQLSENHFELCCIPFFAYNLALGDEMEAVPDGPDYHAILGVLRSSGHSTFRVWFGDSNYPAAQHEVEQELISLGCLVEWYLTDLLAIDTVSNSEVRTVFDLLYQRKQLGHLKFEMANTTNDYEFAVHLNPIWGNLATSLIHAEIRDGTIKRWEQLWARLIADNRFELCCIPFFARDLALGDEVETAPSLENMLVHVIQRVVKPSGHWTFQVLFGNSIDPTARVEVPDEAEKLGCLIEWYSTNLLGISAPSESHSQAIADLLWSKEQLGHLEYQTGRTE